jgi:hypothetical protein
MDDLERSSMFRATAAIKLFPVFRWPDHDIDEITNKSAGSCR